MSCLHWSGAGKRSRSSSRALIGHERAWRNIQLRRLSGGWRQGGRLAGIVTPTQHEDTFRRAYAAMSAGGDLDDLDAVISADYVEHAALPPGVPTGLAGLKAMMTTYRQAFPDFRIAIEKYLEQGDVGCAVVRMTGTQTGSFMGAPASGRAIDITGIDVVRLVDGRCVEHWGVEDDLGLFTQIGLSSIPQQTATTIELPSESRV